MNFQIDPQARQWIQEQGGVLTLEPAGGG